MTSTASTTDVIDRLAGIQPGDSLDAVRRQRPEARANAQASFEALFSPADDSQVSLADRLAIAYWTVSLARAEDAATLYREALAAEASELVVALDEELPGAVATGPTGHYPPGPLSIEDVDGPQYAASPRLREAAGARLAAALEHAHLLTYHVRDASPDALQALLDAGWSTTGIVTISQLIAFIHFQLRVVAGLNILKEAR